MARPLSDEQRERFEDNLSFLRDSHPTLYAKLHHHSEETNFEVTAGGTLTLKVKGSYVESRYRSPDRLQSAVDNGKIPIFLGCGLGYQVNTRCGSGCRGILVERDVEIFRAALYIIEPGILRGLELFIGEEVSSVEKALGNVEASEIEMLEHVRSMKLNRGYYTQVKLVLARLMGASLASSITAQASMRLWSKNVLRNMLVHGGTCFSSINLQNAFEGPVLLVASGPFLGEISDSIRRWSMHMPLLALLPSVPYLQSLGISADYVIATDAGFWNRYRIVRSCKSSLVTTYSADPALVKNWAGSCYLFSHALPIEGLFTAIRECSLVLPMQGTAALVMLLLARLMGFTEQYLAGYDFSFQGLKDHVGGAGFDYFLNQSVTRCQTWETKMLCRLQGDREVTVHDTLGKPVLSTHKLLLYRDWFEREVDLRGVKRLNRGAAIRGIECVAENHMHAYGKNPRRLFEKRKNKLPDMVVPTEHNLRDARNILDRITKADSTHKRAQLHAQLFEPGAGEPRIASDLQFLCEHLEKLLARGT